MNVVVACFVLAIVCIVASTAISLAEMAQRERARRGRETAAERTDGRTGP